jgi:transposase
VAVVNHAFRPAYDMPDIYLYRDPVDFRKSFRGLAAIVEQELGQNPFNGGLYAFTNRQRNKIKCLYWEDNGFVLYYKSLAEEKFRWPRKGDEVVSLTGQQINWLLDGYDISLMTGHKKLHYDSVF